MDIMMDRKANGTLGTATEQTLWQESELFSLLGELLCNRPEPSSTRITRSFSKAVHPDSWESGGQFSHFFLL
jgi:hypothetical protein